MAAQYKPNESATVAVALKRPTVQTQFEHLEMAN
jgi:hypothetical protein